MQENAISAKFNPNSWLRVLFIKNARRVNICLRYEKEEGGEKKVVVSQSLRQLIRYLFPRFSLFILLNATFCQAVAPIFPCFPASVNRDFASSTAFLGTHISSTIIATTDRWMGLQRGKRTSAEKEWRAFPSTVSFFPPVSSQSFNSK